MTTQYTPTLKLALPVTGELSGTWGDVVNDNITSMIEQAIAGLATINSWTGNAHTLTTANGTTSESRCAMLVAATGGGAPSAAAEIICPAAAKLYVLQNNTSYAVTLKTSAGTGVAVAAGDTAFLFCDGTNVNSCVTTIVNGHITGNLTVDGNATINGNTTLGNATSDTVTVTARVASNVLPSADNTYDLGASANAWKDLYVDGTATMALVAISGGTINGVSIGATTPATFLAVDNLSLNGNTIASTDTNGNIVIAPNGTGDVQLDADTVRVGDSGAAVSVTSNGAGALTVTTGGAADLTLSTNSGTDSGTVVIANGVNGNITLTPNGTGDVIVSADRTQFGDSNTDTTLTTNGTGSLNLTTNNGTNSGTIQIAQGANGNITLTPNGTGSVSVPKLVWSNGTSTRVPYLTTGGQFTDSANLTFNGTDLTVSGAVNAGSINATTLDLTNLEVTNIKAKDGTAAMTIADSTGAVTVSSAFSTQGNTTLGDASTDTVTVNGYMGIGGAGSNTIGLYLKNTISTGNIQYGIAAAPVGNGTNQINGIWSGPATAASSFTAGTVAAIRAANATKGAGSTITNLYGLVVEDQTQGTNNYGITSLVSSGTDKWNIYASGTAKNLFAGQVVLTSNTTTEGSLYLQSTAPVIGFTDTNSFSDTSDIAIIRAGTNNLQHQWYDASATATYDLMNQSLTETAFNDSGADIDFRVESDNQTHMLFVDAGNNRVGMGTSTPDTVVEIVDADPVLTIRDTDTSTNTANAKIRFAESGAGDTLGEYWDVGLAPISALTFERMGTEHLRIENTGSFITKPLADGPAVFNENGVDADFRVESDTNTHALFVDAGNSVVNVNSSTSVVSWTSNRRMDVSINTTNATTYPGYAAIAYSSLASGTAGGMLVLGRSASNTPGTAATTVSGDAIGYVTFEGVNSSNNFVSGAFIATYQEGSAGASAIPGSMRFFTGTASATPIERMRLGPSEMVVNETSNDYDFRVESDTSTHALFVQGSDGFVGIGTSSPAARLVVGAAQTCPDPTTVAQFSGTVEICNGVANAYRMQMETDSSTTYFGSNTYYASGWQVFDSGRAPCQIQMTSENLSSHIAFFTSTSNSGNGTEVARVTSDKYLRMASGTGGIQFNGDTAAANALDDYEEGTWTPVIKGGTSDPTITYTKQDGTYVKVGKMLLIQVDVRWSAKSGGSGTLYIGGLPFTANGQYNYGSLTEKSGLTMTAGYTYITAEVAGNTTAFYILQAQASGATTSFSTGDLGSTGYMIGGASIITAS
jgi:hypothetical protein